MHAPPRRARVASPTANLESDCQPALTLPCSLPQVLLMGCVGAFIPLHLHIRSALFFFLVLGWALLLLEWLLLWWCERLLDWLVLKGYHHRKAAEVLLKHLKEGGAQGGAGTASRQLRHSYSLISKMLIMRKSGAEQPDQPAVSIAALITQQQQSEAGTADVAESSPIRRRARRRFTMLPTTSTFLQASEVAGVSPDEVDEVRWHELEKSLFVQKTAANAQSIRDAYEVLQQHPEAGNYAMDPGWRLHALPVLLQIVLLMQCMFHALILTMLGRDSIVQFGAWQGTLFILAMWLPTALMSLFVTPHVIKNVALGRAVVDADHNVLDQMEKGVLRPNVSPVT